MSEINDWDVAAAGNNDPSPNGAPEGMNPSGVNDTMRENMAVISRWQKDTNGSIASTGSSNAYVVAANRTLTAYYDGLEVWFNANHANTGTATLNVDGVAAAAIKKFNDQNLVSGDIDVGQKVGVIYDGTNWQVVSQLGSGVGFDTAGTGLTSTGSTVSIDDGGVNTTQLADGAVALSKFANGVDGELLTWDASGNPDTVSVGTSGQVLTSNGVGAPPTFENNSGGAVTEIDTRTTTGTWNITGLTVGKPLIIAGSLTAAGNGGAWIRTLSGSNDGQTTSTNMGFFIYAQSIASGSQSGNSLIYIPTATTVSLDVLNIDAAGMTLRAYQ